MKARLLTPALSVSPQVRPEDVGAVARQGFAMIINNRPDGEEAGQPSSAALEAAAREHGLAYRHIPVVPGQATPADASAFAAALDEAAGPVLAFCRTGNRSAALFDLAGRHG